MRELRPVLAPTLGVLFIVAVALGFPVGWGRLAESLPFLATLHDTFYLWLVTRYHQYEIVLALVPCALVVFAAPLARKPLPFTGGLRREWWTARVLGSIGLVATCGVVLYLASYRLWRVSPWPWLAAFLCAATVYLWLRLSWAYLPFLRPAYRGCLAAHLSRDSRGREYFGVLARLRSRRGVDPMEGKRFDPTLRRPGHLTSFGVSALTRLMRSSRAGSDVAIRVVRFFAPRLVVGSLRRQDFLLTSQLEHLRAVALHDIESSLYGVGPEETYEEVPLPELDGVAGDAARDAARRWLGFTDALAECHVFGRLGRQAQDDRREEADLIKGAELFAEASRLIIRPTHRRGFEWWGGGKEGDKGWWRTEGGWLEKAIQFVEKEIACLTVLYAKQSPRIRTTADVKTAADLEVGETRPVRGEVHARFAIAHLLLWGLRDRSGDRDHLDAAPTGNTDLVRSIWAAIRSFVDARCTQDRAALRQRYFDAALLRVPGVSGLVVSPHVSFVVFDLEKATKAFRLEQPPSEWHRRELLTLVWARLEQAQLEKMRTNDLRNAIATWKDSKHCSLRAMREHAPELVGVKAALPPQRPAAPAATSWVRLVYQPDAAEAGRWARLPRCLAPPREPNWFTRVVLLSSAALVLLFALVPFTLGRAGAVVPTPDLRIGTRSTPTTINSISPGRGERASVWMATRAGVDVKGAETNHHWHRFDRGNSGLLSDDVLRVDVGSERVVYVCAQEGRSGSRRKGLCLSSLPTFAPGVLPRLSIADWWSLIGFSSFANASDDSLTFLSQPRDCPVALFGGPAGLGRYCPTTRAWLDQEPLDARFLPPDFGGVRDVAAGRDAAGGWHAWIATDNGLAWGPLLESTEAEALATGRAGRVDPEAWKRVVGPLLLAPKVAQVSPRDAARGAASEVDYRTAGGGVGSVVPGEEPSFATHVAGNSLPGLEQDGLVAVGYRGGDGALWVMDRPEARKARVSRYRERTHEWAWLPEEIPTGDVFAFGVDAGQANRAWVGSTGHLLRVEDGGDALGARPLQLEGGQVVGVVSAPGGVGAVTRAAEGSPAGVSYIARESVEASPAGAPGTPGTVIGTRRFDGVSVADLTVVEPRGDDGSLFFGLRRRGVGYLDARQREVYPLSPRHDRPSASQDPADVRDLAALPPAGGGERLLRVTEGEVMQVADVVARDGTVWTTLLGASSGAASPAELRAMTAFEGRLIVGSPSAISAYDPLGHSWSELPPLGGLATLEVAVGRLWAETASRKRRLYALDEEAGWELRFDDVRDYHAAVEAMLVVDGSNRISIEGPTGDQRAIVAPVPLRPGDIRPTQAAVAEGVVYLVPVEGGVGRYDRATHAWEAIPSPLPVSAELRGVHAAPTGLWLWAAEGLFANPLGQAGAFGEWKLAEGDAQSVAFGAGGTLAMQTNGALRWFEIDSEEIAEEPIVEKPVVGGPLVVGSEGQESAVDLERDVIAAVEIRDDLFAAVGAHVARYAIGTHSWTVQRPADAEIKQLVATEKYLYSLDHEGGLSRTDPLGEAWESVGEWIGGKRVEAIAGLAGPDGEIESLGVLVRDPAGVGSDAYRIDDGVERAVWLATRSAGPPPEAVVTCAAEDGGDLLLGTERHGVWAYAVTPADGGASPRRWTRLPTETGEAPIDELELVESHLAVRADGRLALLRRGADLAWVHAHTLDVNSVDIAPSPNGVYFADQHGRLSEALWDGTQRALFDSSNPWKQTPTASVAVDPSANAKEDAVFRADQSGQVARYRWSSHSWSEEKGLAGIPVRDLFASVGRLWAWSPQTRGLHERGQGGWKRLGAELQQVLWNGRALLLHGSDGSLEFHGGEPLLPAAANRRPKLDPTAPSLCVQRGNELFIATGTGFQVYDQRAHRWSLVAERGVVPLGSGGQVIDRGDDLYFLMQGGAVTRIDERGKLKDVDVPAPVAGLTATAVRALAFTARDGGVFSLVGDKVEPFLRPVPLDVGVHTVSATAEWNGRLYLASSSASGAHSIAGYDPERCAWQVQGVDGVVARFLPLGDQLYVQLHDTAEAGLPTERLIRVEAQARELSWSFELVSVRGRAYDVVSDGSNLWTIGEDRRIRHLAGAKGLQVVSPEGDTLRVQPRAVAEFDDALVVHGSDGSLWEYTRGLLAWQKEHEPGSVLRLFDVGGQPHFVDAQGKLFERDSAGWVEILGDAPMLGGGPEVSDLWEVQADQVRWRAEAVEPLEPIGFEGGRLDFDRFAHLQVRDGSLWAETLATRAGQPVVRRFDGKPGTLSGGELAEAPDAARAREEDPSLPLAGKRFVVQIVDDGTWSGWDNAHGKVAFDLSLRPMAEGAMDIPLDLVGGVGRQTFAVDAWVQIEAASGGTLVAASGAGLVACTLTGPGQLTRQALHDPGQATVALAPAGQTVVAKLADETYRELDLGHAGWRPVAGDALENYHSVRRCNSLLDDWSVEGAASVTSMMLDLGADPVQISLGPEGFGFDRPAAIGLTDGANAELYTPDGLVVVATGKGTAPLARIDPDYATGPIEGPCAVAVRGGRRFVLSDGTGPDRGWERAAGAWRAMPADSLAQLRADLREVLFDDHGWTWGSDDRVSVSHGPFAKDPLEASYSAASGRFTFDSARAVQSDGPELTVVSDGGVLTLLGEKATRADLDGDSPFGNVVEARLVRGLAGQRLLQVGAPATAPSVFEYANGRWAAGGPREVEKVTPWLLRGDRWQIERSEINVRAGDPRTLRMATGSGDDFASIRLLPDGFEHERLTGICSVRGGVLLGSEAGAQVLRGTSREPEHFAPLGPVERVEREGDGAHVQLRNGKELLLDQRLEAAGEPAQTFEQKDARILPGGGKRDRWRIEKDDQPAVRNESRAVIDHRPAPGAVFERVAFAEGRFDFDRVLAAGVDAGRLLLATDFGYVYRDLDSPDRFELDAALGKLRPGAARPEIFALWFQGARQLFVQRDVAVWAKAGGGWQPLVTELAERVLETRAVQVAANPHWSFELGRAGLIGHFAVGDSSRRVDFLPEMGAFGFDVTREVSFRPAAGGEPAGVLAATLGGLCTYSLDGALTGLESDLVPGDRLARVDPCKLLEDTAGGPIAVVESGGVEHSFRWQPPGWVKLGGAAAHQALADARAVECDRDGWRVTIDPETDDRSVTWRGEPVSLVDDSEADSRARFAHDRVRSIDWAEGVLWVATEGGVLRFDADPSVDSFPPRAQRHLAASELPGAGTGELGPISIRSQARGVVLRSAGGTFLWDRASLAFVEFVPGAGDQGASVDVLVDRKGRWTWRLDDERRLKVELDRQTFPELDSDALFHGGTLAFWSLPPAEPFVAPPLTFADEWFVATAAGIARFSQDWSRLIRVYQTALDGRDLRGSAHLLVWNGAPVAFTDDRSGLAPYAFKAAANSWDLLAIRGDLPWRPAPVKTAWLELSYPDERSIRLALRRDVADVQSAAGTILAEGRFLFDDVQDFVWHDSAFWLKTPAGIARIDGRQNGELSLYRRDLIEELEGSRLHVDGSGDLHLVGSPVGAWRWTGQNAWLPVQDAVAVVEDFVRVIDNELLVARRPFGFEDPYSVQIQPALGRFPSFSIPSSIPQLLVNGVFRFDDLMDAKLRGEDELVLSTRLGVWHYPLDLDRPVAIPERGVYWADSDGGPVEMTELSSFFRSSMHPERVILQADGGKRSFALGTDDAWALEPSPPMRDETFEMTDASGQTWRVSEESDRLKVTRGDAQVEYWPAAGTTLTDAGAGEILYESIFVTPRSMWIPLEKELLWVRKWRF